MKPRIPLAYAGFLIIALVAVVGFAAFSPSQTASEPVTTSSSASEVPNASARVASAILALRVSDAESRTATTTAQPTTAAESTTTASDDAAEPTTTTEAVVEVTTTPAPASQSAAPAPPADTTPPALSITSPDDESTVDDRIVTFKGRTEPGASVASGPYEADVDDDGTWTIRLVVVAGPNGASFTATDDAGNSTTERIVVYYEAPSTTTTTKAPSTTTTTTARSDSAPTTTAPAAPKWSPLWPADQAGKRDVESWRSTVAAYFPAERVDCVLGIIKRESGGDPTAYNSSSSAEGLMQHLSKYWHARAKGAGFVDGDGLVATPHNGEANIAAGAWLASYYDRTTGDWWSPWKSNGQFTAFYGSCQSPDPS